MASHSAASAPESASKSGNETSRDSELRLVSFLARLQELERKVSEDPGCSSGLQHGTC